MIFRFIAFLLALISSLGGVQARPSLELLKAAEAPVVDGVLDDAVWAAAAVIDDFGQVEPNTGAPPTERTEVRVLITETALYIGARCFDSEPGKVLARDRRRDSTGSGDDRFRVVIDPFGRGTDGYFFGLAAGGAKGDGVVRNGGRPAMEWDTIWDARTSVDEQGWVVEMEIPFRSIAFNGDSSEWGFNVERVIRRRQEQVRWASATRERSLYALEGAGTIRGMTGLKTGLGLDLKPTLVARSSSSHGGAGDDFELEPSIDAFYRLTPSLTATLTWRTDFAETEVDERVVNTTRFPLFFPEQRSFFLEDARHFRFGGIRRSPLPFHSRTIGLSSAGQRVPIEVGGKVTGKVGKWNLGLLGVSLDGTEELEADEVFVGRVGYDLFDESSVGGIFTLGDPRANGDAQTYGFDFRLKDSSFRQSTNKTGELIGWALQTDNDGVSDYGWGLTASYPNSPIGFRSGIQRVGEDLDPAMGFVRRLGIYEIINSIEHEWYPSESIWNEISVEVESWIDTDLDFNALSERHGAEWDFEMDSGDRLNLDFGRTRERFLEGFEISDGVIVPVGDYTGWQALAGFSTARSRRWNFRTSGYVNDYLDGDRYGIESSVGWSPSPLWSLTAEANVDWFDLPGGEFETVVLNGAVRFTPSTEVSLTTNLQFDNVSEEIGVNARLHWIVKPGSDIYLVYNQSLGHVDERRRYQSIAREGVAKVGWTVRF